MTALLKNWHFMRFLRLGIAIWAFMEAIRTGEWLLLIPGGLFAMQAIFDVGCCGSAGCGDPRRVQALESTGQHSEEIIAEEVR